MTAPRRVEQTSRAPSGARTANMPSPTEEEAPPSPRWRTRRAGPDAEADATATAVVTGLGVVAPNGVGTEAYWTATLAGRSGLGRMAAGTASPVRVAGRIETFIGAECLPSRLVVQTDRWSHLGLAAARMALDDAELDDRKLEALPGYELSVVTASSCGGAEFGQREIERLWTKGPRSVSAYQSIAWFYAATSGQVSIRHGMRGTCGVICTEQAGGLDAVGEARRLLKEGARVVVVGGTEAPLSPYAALAWATGRPVSRRADPERAFRPFDVDASGQVPGEGGAMLVIERAESAHARGARAYAEIVGYGASFDPVQETGRRRGLGAAAEQALADAGVPPDLVDVVFADASGDPDEDQEEADAINALFGPGQVPVAVPKTMTGRLGSGGGALDLAAAVLTIRDGVIPPMISVTEPAPWCELDLVRDVPRSVSVETALVLARGYGGFNAAVVVRRPGGTPMSKGV